VALLDTLGEWMTYAALYTEHGGSPPPRTGATHATIAPYGPFRTRDGAIVVAVQSNREWVRFCEHVLQQPALAEDARFATNGLRARHRDVLGTVIEAAFSQLPLAEVVRRLDAADIASANVNSVEQYIQHPQLAARDCWRQIDTPAGVVRALVPPVRMQGIEPVMGAVPALGQHTRAVLEELAFDRDTIALWAESGVI
jgi:crotonobetainyl-CoA:carnitine CoA-transferase CaiB-like acyl-CoA transferase